MSDTGKTTHSKINRWFMAMSVILFSYEAVMAGFNLGKHSYANAGFDGILAVFWLGFAAIMVMERIADAKFEEMDRSFEKLTGLLKTMADKADDKKHAETMAELLVDCTDEIVMANNKGKRRAPTQTEVAAIEQLFHDKTGDHYAKLTVVKGGVEAQISSEPIDVAPGRSEAHEAARKRGDAARAEKHSTRIPVIDGDKEAEVHERRRQAGIKSAETRKRNLALKASKKG